MYHHLDSTSTCSPYETVTCPRCNGKGKIKKITTTVITETYETI